MSRRSWISSSIIVIIVCLTVIARYQGRWGFQDAISNNILAGIIFTGLVGLNHTINEEFLEDPLTIVNNLFTYPWYRLALFGIGIISGLALVDNSFDKLVVCFAVSSITLHRDHRWAAFIAMDMLIIVIVMLLIQQQSLADTMAIYLYYFLVIATITMMINPSDPSYKHHHTTKHHQSDE